MYIYTYSVTSYGDIVFHFSPFISFFFILLFNFIYLFLSTFTIIYFIPSSYSLEFKHKSKTTNFLLGSCSLLSLSLSIFDEDSINQTLINMKGIDHIFCASQASTAICLSMQQDEASSSSTIHLGGRAIDRHNPIIRDARRITRALPSAPCSSEPLPINPKPYHQLPKPNNNKKSSSFSNKKSSRDKQKKSSSNSKPLAEQTNKIPSISNNDVTIYKDCYTAMPADIKKKSCAQLGDFITPPGSSRYLLSDAAFFDGLSDYDPVLALVPETGPEKTSVLINGDDSSVAKSPFSSSRSEKPPSNQVRLKEAYIFHFQKVLITFEMHAPTSVRILSHVTFNQLCIYLRVNVYLSTFCETVYRESTRCSFDRLMVNV